MSAFEKMKKIMLWKFLHLPVVVIVVTLLIVIFKPGSIGAIIGVLIAVFDGINGIVDLQKAFDMKKNVTILKNANLIDTMNSEAEKVSDYEYTITKTFVWSKKRHLCVPIDEIASIRCSRLKCVNNAAKNQCDMVIKTKSKKSMYLFHFNGFGTNAKCEIMIECADKLLKRNPSIVIL